MSCKTTKFGAKKYQIKLVGIEKSIWVTGNHLSSGVVAGYDEGSTLPKNAKAQVDRAYVDKQKKSITQVPFVMINEDACVNPKMMHLYRFVRYLCRFHSDT